VRPCVSYHPFIDTLHPGMDLVIVRENEEDCYAGIEYQLSPGAMQCLKLITRPGCEKIVRYAFEYARRHGRKKVTCFTKDNIMKMTDGDSGLGRFMPRRRPQWLRGARHAPQTSRA
jgi:isocitrate dehydrogenase